MSEQNKPFVITDRRKFTLDGELRPDAVLSEPEEQATSVPPAEPIDAQPEPTPAPESVASVESASEPQAENDLPPALTEEQITQVRRAYESTAERLDTAIRATNPGMDHIPPMNFERLVSSIYMTAIVQMGGSTPEGEQARVDLMGARQSIDMLSIVEEKTKSNLSADEKNLIESALFELRMGFLEITQALARQSAARTPGGPGGMPGAPGGRPSIVR